METTLQQAPASAISQEDFLADRQRFWASAIRFMTRVAIGLVVLLVLLWWFLV